MLKHVHFGAGAFGLGFVCWLTHLTEYQTVIFNRSERVEGQGNIERLIKHGNRYSVQIEDDTDRKQEVLLSDAISLSPDDNSAQWLQVVCDHDLSLITTAIKFIDGLEYYYKIILDAAEHRYTEDKERPIYILACENGFTSLDVRDWLLRKRPELQEVIDTVLVFVPCVVDRICTPGLGSEGQVIIQTEQFAKLFVAKEVERNGRRWNISRVGDLLSPNLTEGITDLRKRRISEVVEFVDDINKYRRMKSLIVNGSHVIIALRALQMGYYNIDEFVVQNPNWCKLVFDEMASIASLDEATKTIDARFFSKCSQFAKETQTRFSKRRDLVSRVLSRFTDPYLDVIDGVFLGKTSPPVTFIDSSSAFFDSLLKKVLIPAQDFAVVTENVPRRCFEASIDVARLISEARYPSLSVIRGPEFHKELIKLVLKHKQNLDSFVMAND